MAIEASLADWKGRARSISLQVSDSSPLLSAEREDRKAADQYRLVRTKIVQHPRNPSIVVVSSPGTGDGKTVTAVNLAAALALSSEEKVLLLDADFHRSMVHAYLGISEVPGLAEVLAGTSPFENALLCVRQLPNLYVLPAGESNIHPTELLASPCWRAFTCRIQQHFRRVIVDCPPVEAVADYDLITAVCDGVFLVVRPDHTDRRLCFSALKTIGEKLLGVIINDLKDWFLWKDHRSFYLHDQRG